MVAKERKNMESEMFNTCEKENLRCSRQGADEPNNEWMKLKEAEPTLQIRTNNLALFT